MIKKNGKMRRMKTKKKKYIYFPLKKNNKRKKIYKIVINII